MEPTQVDIELEKQVVSALTLVISKVSKVLTSGQRPSEITWAVTQVAKASSQIEVLQIDLSVLEKPIKVSQHFDELTWNSTNA